MFAAPWPFKNSDRIPRVLGDVALEVRVLRQEWIEQSGPDVRRQRERRNTPATRCRKD